LAQKKLSAGEILVLAGGTGNPFFTTDTAAALRASEIGADLLLKATKVDGIYDKDPLQNKNAIFYPTIRYSDMLAQKLMVMDATAIALCMSRRLAIRVFNMKLLFEPTFPKLLAEGNLGSLVIEN
jgi:uridylate kinase